MRNKQPGPRPDPHDFSEGWEEWEVAIVACAAYFRLIGFSPTSFACVELPTFDDVRAFLADDAEPQYTLVYAVTAAGQEVCISGPRFEHFAEVWQRWNPAQAEAKA